MIARIWRGWADLDRADAYPAHFERVVVPDLLATPGFVDAQLLQRADGDRIEFTVISRWRDRAAIAAFAGDRPERAVVEPGAVAALVEVEETVRHHEVRLGVDPASGSG